MERFIELINKKEDKQDFFISLFTLLYVRKIYLGQKIYDIDLVGTPGQFISADSTKEQSALFEKNLVILN